MKFTWFFIEPIAIVAVAPSVAYFWINVLVALILKFVMTKTLGEEKFVRYMRPMTAGVISGHMATLMIGVLIEFATVAWPSFQSLYIP